MYRFDSANLVGKFYSIIDEMYNDIIYMLEDNDIIYMLEDKAIL